MELGLSPTGSRILYQPYAELASVHRSLQQRQLLGSIHRAMHMIGLAVLLPALKRIFLVRDGTIIIFGYMISVAIGFIVCIQKFVWQQVSLYWLFATKGDGYLRSRNVFTGISQSLLTDGIFVTGSGTSDFFIAIAIEISACSVHESDVNRAWYGCTGRPHR